MTSPILITGASGTLGKELVKQLRSRGADFAVMSSKLAAAVGGLPAVHGDFADAGSLRMAGDNNRKTARPGRYCVLKSKTTT